MKKFFQNQKILIVVLIYIGIIISLFYFVILPLVSKIKETNNQIQEGNIKQSMMKQRIEELPKIKEQYNILQEHKNLEDVLLDRNNPVALIEKLEKIAKDSNDEIKISVQNPQLEKNVTNTKNKKVVENSLLNSLPNKEYLQMQISLKGFYNNIINFIIKLESAEYYFDIVGIKIQQAGMEDEQKSDPFNSNLLIDSEKASSESKEKKLEATLDVVFYVKK